METMSMSTAGATDGLYLLFPHGLKDSSAVWLGSGYLEKIVVGPGTTAPAAQLDVVVYDAFDQSTGRALKHATDGTRLKVAPGGTITGTRSTNGSPYAAVGTLTLTNLVIVAKFSVLMNSVDVLVPVHRIIDKHCVNGMIIGVTTQTGETGIWNIDCHYYPEVSGGTRKVVTANNQPAHAL